LLWFQATADWAVALKQGGLFSARLGYRRYRQTAQLHMFKKHYILAIVAFLAIPPVTVLGGVLFSAINPEIAAHYPNYVRNYWLLHLLKLSFIWLSWLADVGLGFLTCFFLVKSKNQSYRWLFLAALGPFGIMILTMLRDKAPAPGDMYQHFVGKLKIYLRIPLELCIFVLVQTVAEQAMVLKRDLQIMYEAAVTGATIEQIIDVRNASGGMWAFSEGMLVMYLMVLFYLLWPICFNAVCRLPKLLASASKA
jgi:hypothetical protein